MGTLGPGFLLRTPHIRFGSCPLGGGGQGVEWGQEEVKSKGQEEEGLRAFRVP